MDIVTEHRAFDVKSDQHAQCALVLALEYLSPILVRDKIQRPDGPRPLGAITINITITSILTDSGPRTVPRLYPALLLPLVWHAS